MISIEQKQSTLQLRRVLLFVAFVLVQLTTQAQFFDTIQSSLTHKPRLDLKLESRNSFFANEWAMIGGARIGLDYHKTFKMGVGYNWLRKEIQHTITIADQPTQADYFFHYGVFYAEYTFYNVKPFSMSIYASLGGGRSWDRYIVSTGERETANSAFVLVYEPYMSGMVDVLKYFSVGGGMGFRLVATGSKYSRSKLNTLIYVFKLNIKVSKLMDEMGR
tara:strand:+ start:29804 stop:30460 length:657 start_codon:yes stop_codon:yes gene_type:complete